MPGMQINSPRSSNQTVSLLTPGGKAAVATIRVTGNSSPEHMDQFFCAASGAKCRQQNVQQIRFGKWQTGLCKGEELVVTRVADDCFEIHCHGGVLIAQAIVNCFAEIGYVQTSWYESLISGDDVSCSKLAMAELIQAKTERTAAYLNFQTSGRWEIEFHTLQQLIAAGRMQEASFRIDEHMKHWEFGKHLISPWRIVLAGQPNVGKSSLINEILGFERTIVYDQPGTTRDVISVDTAINGWPVEFLDTAGQRISEDQIERIGISKAEQSMQEADLLVWVADATKPETWESLPEITSPTIVVINKSDLNDQSIDWPEFPTVISTSCREHEGIAELVQLIETCIVPEPPPLDSLIPFCDTIVRRLKDMQSGLLP